MPGLFKRHQKPMEIYRIEDAGLITEKRQKIPYALEHTCDCGNFIRYEFHKSSHLSHVSIGDVDEFTVYCNYCEKEETVKIRFNMLLELVEGEKHE